MKTFARVFAPLCALAFAPPAVGQQPGGGWSYPALATVEPAPPPLPPAGVGEVPRPNSFPTYAPERPAPAEALPPARATTGSSTGCR